MKNNIKSIIAILVLAMLMFSMTACQEGPLIIDPPISLAVVYSQRAGNSTSASYFDTRLDGERNSLIYKAGSPGSETIVITTSGSPFQSKPAVIPKNDAVTPEQVRDDQYYYSEKNKDSILSTIANAPEADTFEALKLAANWLGIQPDDQPKYCLVIDNGICTTGTLSFFQEGFLTAEPEEIVRKLAEKGGMPDLGGVTVVFAGLGCTSSPQKEPGNEARARLETLWSLIVTESGGTAVIAKDKYATETSDGEYPVSVVDFPPDQPFQFDPKQVDFKAAAFLGEDQVQFIGDKWEYLYPDKAEEVIKPIADYMLENPELNLLLVGTTAGDETTEWTMELSKNRANTVKDTLVSLGVSENRITTRGLGSSDPWHIYGIGTSSPEASKNRKVVVLDRDCPEAMEIIGNSYEG